MQMIGWRRHKIGVILRISVAFAIAIGLFENCGAGIGKIREASLLSRSLVSSASCPNTQAPIGTSGGKVICAATQASAQSSCPTANAYYQSSNGKAICVAQSSWDQPGAVCGVGQYLVSFADNSITCRLPLLAGVSQAQCPAGQYIMGSSNNEVVCSTLAPGSVPTPTTCASNNYLADLTTTGALCQPQIWASAGTQGCVAGTMVLGFSGSTLLCQMSSLSLAGVSVNCPTGQVLLGYSNGQANCLPPPDLDLSNACQTGFILSGITDNRLQCHLAGKNEGAACAPGLYLTGLANGNPICTAIVMNHLTGNCGSASFPSGVSNGSLICSAFANADYDSAQTCQPGSSETCALFGGTGTQSCESSGQTYSTCLATVCRSGFQLSGGLCLAQNCFPGSTQNCPVANGSALQTCGSDGSWGDCQVTSCTGDFVSTGTQCLTKMCSSADPAIPCTAQAGSGYKSCLDNNTGYGACHLTNCNNGYTMTAGVCVDTTPPRVTFPTPPQNPAFGNQLSFTFAVVDGESGVATTSCRLDNTNYTPCQSPVNLTGLTNGAHSFTVQASDRASNASSQTLNWTSSVCLAAKACTGDHGYGSLACQADGTFASVCKLNTCDTGYNPKSGACSAIQCGPGLSLVGNNCVDNIAPDLAVASVPTAIGAALVTVTFTEQDSGSGLKSTLCQLDNSVATACASPYAPPGQPLAFGPHALSVTATDGAGNVSTQSTNWMNLSCSPGTTQACPINNGTGQSTCLADGSNYGACQVSSCNDGFINNGNTCSSMVCQPGSQVSCTSAQNTQGVSTCSPDGSGYGSCAICTPGAQKACNMDGTPYPNSSNGNTACTGGGVNCYTAVGAATCSSDGTSFGSCAFSGCQIPGYALVGTQCSNVCSPGTNYCFVPHSFASQTCSSDGQTLSDCTVIHCADGFDLIGNRCAAQVHRWFDPINHDHFYVPKQNEGPGPGGTYTFESTPFRVFLEDGPGTVALYSCATSTGYHFLSNDPGCEGAQGSLMGYIYPAPAGGSGPNALVRMVWSAKHDRIEAVAPMKTDPDYNPNFIYSTTLGTVP